jgi:uncharacterized membrane protein YjjB (DUF3815 family)
MHQIKSKAYQHASVWIGAIIVGVAAVLYAIDLKIILLPFMIAAFLSHGIGKWIIPTPLYSFLAGRHNYIGKS